MSDTPQPRKKGGLMKLLIPVIGGVVLIGAGAGGGYFAASSGMLGGGAPKPAHDGPQRVERPARDTTHQVDSDGDGQSDTSYFELKKEFNYNMMAPKRYLTVALAHAPTSVSKAGRPTGRERRDQ